MPTSLRSVMGLRPNFQLSPAHLASLGDGLAPYIITKSQMKESKLSHLAFSDYAWLN